MSKVSALLGFTRHYMNSIPHDAFHSPYLFELFKHCINDSATTDGVKFIEKERSGFRRSQEMIQRQDYGAGNRENGLQHRETIAHIAKSALSKPFQCRFMYRLAEFHQPAEVLELGTSLGISTAYLCCGYPGAKVTTVEGDPALFQHAVALFEKLKLHRIECVNTKFYDFIGQLEKETSYDLVFIDGHHHGDALLQYVNDLRPHLSESAILIVDDIHWSPDMMNAWRKVISLPFVTQSVDCFFFGLVFTSKNFVQKKHHHIRFPLRFILT